VVLELLHKQLELHRGRMERGEVSGVAPGTCPVFAGSAADGGGCPFKECSSELLAQVRLCPKFAHGMCTHVCVCVCVCVCECGVCTTYVW
jgi:hypothetical protein